MENHLILLFWYALFINDLVIWYGSRSKTVAILVSFFFFF